MTEIKDNALSQMEQVPIRKATDFDLDEAIDYASQDIETWRTTAKNKKWLPGIKFVFEYDFKFDAEIEAEFDEEIANKV